MNIDPYDRSLLDPFLEVKNQLDDYYIFFHVLHIWREQVERRLSVKGARMDNERRERERAIMVLNII